jgi:CSLREA domain-containing protein
MRQETLAVHTLSTRSSQGTYVATPHSLVKFSLCRFACIAVFTLCVLLFGAHAAHADDCSTIGTKLTTTGTATANLSIGDYVTVATPSSGGQSTGTLFDTSGFTVISAPSSTQHGFAATTGVYTLSSTYTVSYSCTQAPVYYVNTATDNDGSNFQNCINGSGSCSLRDALHATAVYNQTTTKPVMIAFSSTLAGSGGTTPFTITETNGTMTITGDVGVQGLTSGPSTNVQNLVTVVGDGSHAVFTVTGLSDGAWINNLNVTGGGSTTIGIGGGITGSGTLAVNQSNIMSNGVLNAPSQGGGIYFSGTLTLQNTAVINNNASDTGGGIFMAGGAINAYNTTIAGNTATNAGGGLDVKNGTVTLSAITVSTNTSSNGGGINFEAGGSISVVSNYIIAEGNTASVSSADIDIGSVTIVVPYGGSNLLNTSTSSGIVSPGLAPLGFYGGPTYTMPALPTSPAFCAGDSMGTDQRGVARANKYITVHCTDVGATSSKFSVAFTTQPAASYYVAADLSTTAPVLQFEDDGFPLPATGSMIFSDADSALTGTTTVTMSAGAASPTAASISSAQASDTISGKYGLKIGLGTYGLGATSSSFSVITPVAGFQISTLSNVTPGTAQSFTVTALSSLNPVRTATNYTGTITFTSSDPNVLLPLSYTFTNGDAGVHTFTGGLEFITSGSQTISVAAGNISQQSNTVTVAAGPPVSVVASSGTPQTAAIGSAFAAPLAAQVLDAYSNPVPSVTVRFNTPASGATAALSATSCTTNTTSPIGVCSVTATANATLSSSAYAVTATAAGATSNASFSLTNSMVTPTLTVTTSPASLVYGQPVTITATSVPASAGGVTPAGAVTFYDNANTLTSTASPSAGVSTYSTTALLGSQTYAASSAADTNFKAVAKTSAAPIVVGIASSTLAGPGTNPFLVVINTVGTVPITIAGQYAGTSVATPTGSITFSLATGAGVPVPLTSTTATVTAGTPGTNATSSASVVLPSTLPSGLYNLTVNYVGDSNYGAAISVVVPVQVSGVTPTANYPAQAAISYGSLLTASNFNATFVYASNSVASLGSVAYTATLVGGSAAAIAVGTKLPVGTYTLTATWTPSAGSASTLYTAATATATLVVNAAPATISVVPSLTQANQYSLITFTATLSSAVAGAFNGTVAFSINGTPSGTAGVSNGVAIFTTSLSSAPPGPSSISVTYTGDSNYVVATPGTTSVTLGTASYTMSANPSSLDAKAGYPITSTLTITPTFGFAGTFNLDCAQLPFDSVCTFQPNTLTATGNNVPVSSVVTFYTLGNYQEGKSTGSSSGLILPGALFALLIVFSRRSMSVPLRRLIVLAALAMLAVGTNGCGRASFATPKGTTTISITVAGTGAPGTGSSNQTQTLSMTLTVQ